MQVEALYKVAHILGTAGKAYLDDKLVKKCLVETIEYIHPDKESDFATIPQHQ